MASRHAYLTLIAVLGLSYGATAAGSPLSTVQYESTPPARFHAMDLYYPPGGQGGARKPIIVLVHGGGFVGGDKSDAAIRTMARQLTEEGFVVAAVNYRLAGSGGAATSPHESSPFPDGLNDVKSAVRWLRTNATQLNIDGGRMGAVGHSAGANLAAQLGVTSDSSVRVQAVVSFSGLLDLQYQQPAGTPDYRPYYVPYSRVLERCGTPENCKAQDDRDPRCSHLPPGSPDSLRPGRCSTYGEASPTTQVTAHSSPFLLFHGLADRHVWPENSRHLHAKLRAAGVESRLIEVPGVTHELKRFKQRVIPGTGGKNSWQVTLAFLRSHLAGPRQVARALTRSGAGIQCLNAESSALPEVEMPSALDQILQTIH